MKYKVRLNPKALNPLTMKINEKLLWEVEQCLALGGNGRTDSEKVIWHCADVRIDKTPIGKLFRLESKWELEVEGMALRGQDNAIEIHTGAHDAY